MKFLTLTQNSGAKTIYVNEALVISFTAAQSGGSTLVFSNGNGFTADQSPAQILAML